MIFKSSQIDILITRNREVLMLNYKELILRNDREEENYVTLSYTVISH